MASPYFGCEKSCKVGHSDAAELHKVSINYRE